MSTFRILPPPGGHTVTLPGVNRTYAGADATPIDVSGLDAELLVQQNNGRGLWSFTSPGVPCGSTANRPNPAAMGFNAMYLDTTLGYIIFWNPVLKAWINPATGVLV